MEHRFGAHFTLAASISKLLPRTVIGTDFKSVKPVIEFYIETDFIRCAVEEVQSQFEAWKTRCELIAKDQPKLGVKEALVLSNRESTKHIHRLLLAYAAIPLSSGMTFPVSFSDFRAIFSIVRTIIFGPEAHQNMAPQPYGRRASGWSGRIPPQQEYSGFI